VDAHVGQSLFNDAILGLKDRGKAVILVTHALHFLPQVDHIYHLTNGVIHEEGTYEELISNGGLFSILVRDFGSQNARRSQAHEDDTEVHLDGNKATNPAAEEGNTKVGRALMQLETRKIGSISGAGLSSTRPQFLILIIFCSHLELYRGGRRDLSPSVGSIFCNPYARLVTPPWAHPFQSFHMSRLRSLSGPH
jgi:ABC-type sugar transport system ATPase subunit